MILQEPVIYHQDLSTVQLLFESVKTLGAVAGFWLVWYVKGVNTSLKTIETDINDIKVDLGKSGVSMKNIDERLLKVEQEQRDQLHAWISHTNKYGNGLEWAKRSSENHH